MSNELDELDERTIIVLDDYHRIIEPRVHRFVADLMRNPPAGIHLVIVTREEPPLPIGTLRAQGRLAELRMADLAFSIGDLRLFMDQVLGRSLTAEQIDKLHTSTEGWPAGARLAAHALRNDDDAIVGAGYLDAAAQGYLVADVIDHVPAEVRRHLVAASYFDRFSAELCDTIAATNPTPTAAVTMTGAEFIDWIHRHNLFVVQLDAHGDWHRFHHQFARLLANWRESSDTAISEHDMRRAAAIIFRDQGMIDEAIEQLHLANAHHDLATIAATHGNQLIEQERWVELDRLLSDIPTDLLDTDPELLILSAWLLGMVLFRHREMREVLDRVEFLLDQSNDAQMPTVSRLRGHVAMLRGAYVKLVQSDFEGAIADSEEARRRLHDHPGRSLAFAYTLGVISLASSGQSGDAYRLADSLVGDPRFADLPLDPTTWARLVLAWLEGDLDALERHAATARSIGARLGLPGITAVGHYFSGTCAYEQNRLVDAERHLAIVFDLRFTAEAILVVEAGAALACTELALGRRDDADATTEALRRFVIDTHSEFLQPVADAFGAELDLRRGRTRSGLRWARSTNLATDQHRFLWYDTGPAQIEVLLASEPDATRGRQLLARALESAQRRHHRPLTIRLLGIHALDLATQGNEPAALDTLQTAVRMAHHGGIVRRLADLGPPLAPLLHRLDVTGDLLTHVGAILTAIEPPTREPSDTTTASPTAVPGEPALTAREADVLRLLATRYSNKEIARELIIAPATVKKHTVTLYDKLNVHGRREAVAKAHTLGYINS